MWAVEKGKQLIGKRPAVTLLLVAAAFLGLRLTIVPLVWPEKPPMQCIEQPYDGCGFIFDEAHYIPAVRRLIYLGQNTNLEHPPLTKSLIALGISIFGDNPWGWRTFNTIFSAITVLLAGLIALRLGGRPDLALAAQLFLITDVTFLSLSGTAILDPPALAFMLLGVYLMLHGRRTLAGASMGMSLLSKTSGVIALAALIGSEAVNAYSKTGDLDKAVQTIRKALFDVVIPAAMVFVLGVGIYDGLTHAFESPVQHIGFMFDYHSNLRYNNPAEVELPLTWILPPVTRHPAPYFVVTVNPPGYHPVALWGVSTPLWWSIWFVFPLTYLLVKRAASRPGSVENPNPESIYLAWVGLTIAAYGILAYLLRRWTYSFYFMQASVLMAALTPLILMRAGMDRWIKVLLIAQAFWFLLFIPVKPLWLSELLNYLGLDIR
jgi:predicted membrane-bound dolichyl-phosphate-mannose-protein mannosyltransferase